MGLAPESAKDGDLVCVILGASVPFILRERNNNVFQLVGEPYVHGYMDGEAFDQFDSDKLSRVKFTIW
jgi:hypothetical protein